MGLQGSNQHIDLVNRPSVEPDERCWALKSSPLREPDEGEIQVRLTYLSIDPAMRGWIADQDSYLPPVVIGEIMRALAIGEVVASRNEAYEVGDVVSGMFGVQQYVTLAPDPSVAKIDPNLAPLTTHLGLLGMPGMTAYFGLLEVGRPKEGDTLLISGAAGAVGALVGQIGKIMGCRVVGVAGGKDKCDFLINSLGFDAAIDYKASTDLSASIAEVCPEKVSLFFDNVGGPVLDAAVNNLSHRAKIVICGAISQYNNADSVESKINYIPILYNSASLEGFVILDYVSRYGEAVTAISKWLAAGLVVPHEDLREGIENFPSVLSDLFTGKNFGKLLLKVG